MDASKYMKFSTKAIHIGQKPDPNNGAVIPPIFLTSTYRQKYPGVFEIYDYARGFNPNFTYLEETLASLEGGKYATVFSSGLGALTSVILTLSSGDKVIAINDLYGGTYRLFKTIFARFGIKFNLIDVENEKLLVNELKSKPKFLILESPTNPLLKITDIAKITSIAKRFGTKTIVDNTFASPYFQNPLNLGADIVLHSTTKYIAGHADIIGGAVISNDLNLKKQMEYNRNAVGLNPDPFACWLISRGVKTLPIRMEQHQKNAFAVANFLAKHPRVKKVYYPGLSTHPNHHIAKKQMTGFSGIVSVEFKLSYTQTKKLITLFKLIVLAESLGGVISLVDHPASMTHSAVPKKEREKVGFTDGLIRISVGLEDSSDLISDLDQALSKV